MRMNNALTTLVGEELEGDCKYCATLAAPNGSLYGIPSRAGRVAKFNPVDKSMTEIGPDFGDGYKWYEGAITDNGIIYCPPVDDRRGILKIDTNTDNVTELDKNLLPERGRTNMWTSCAAALDGCIYFMPYHARRIMKLDPNNNNAMSSVGDDLGDEHYKYTGTVVGIDGCVYGIPWRSKRILKFDPINDTTSFVGEEADGYFYCSGGGALARDGCIYAMTFTGQVGQVGQVGRVLRIDTTNNIHCFVENSVEAAEPGSVDSAERYGVRSVGDAILGIDGCIYWPPYNASYTLKYDPHTNQTSLVGDNYGSRDKYGRDSIKWHGGCLAFDGVIYCIPDRAERILSIDPLKEFSVTMKNNIKECPQNFGFLFERPEQTESYFYNGITKKPPLHRVCKTNFDHAVVKFGQEKVIQVLDKNMKPVNDFCRRSNLFPFMIVASHKESSASMIYHFLCQDLSWVNGIGNVAEREKIQNSPSEA